MGMAWTLNYKVEAFSPIIAFMDCDFSSAKGNLAIYAPQRSNCDVEDDVEWYAVVERWMDVWTRLWMWKLQQDM
jgi:hypothetical protein